MADTPPEIVRIDALTATGKTNWFALLAYLVFAYITVLGVEDADFFIAERLTELPIVNIAIPTISFFIFAPVLGVALYIYLHLHVRKVSEALMADVSSENGMTLERRIRPWLLNDLILRRHDPNTIERRELDGLADIVTVLLVWVAGPFVLGTLWTRSFVLHSVWLTTLCGACFFAAIVVGCISWRKMEQDCDARVKWARLPPRNMYQRAIPVALFLALYGVLGTKGITIRALIPTYEAVFDSPAPDWMNARLIAAAPQLREARLSALPPDEADPVSARAKYRAEWCQRIGHPPLVCGTLPAASISEPTYREGERLAWCNGRSNPMNAEDCTSYFSTKDNEFEAEWRAFRTAKVAALPKPIMRGRDIRNADLAFASLTGIDFRKAQMEGANLDGAQMEGADLSLAQMEQADLTGAQMEGANLSGAQMVGADLDGAQLGGADLTAANMEAALFREALLEGADFRNANLTSAVLARARMDRVDLRGVRLDDALLTGAQMENSNLRGATMLGAELNGAQMKGADLRNVEMNGSHLFRADMEGADLSGAQMKGASLGEVVMKGAILIEAQMQGATLFNANLIDADLSRANIEGAELTGATMEGANLARARLTSANLHGAQMEGAILYEAKIEQAYLSYAQLEGAIFYGSQMNGADLSWAEINRANLSGAQLNGSNLIGARMESVRLSRSQMEKANLSASYIVGGENGDVVFDRTNVSASVNHGGALRFVDLSGAVFDDQTDFRNAFLTDSVILPDDPLLGLRDLCQMVPEPLTDEEFHAHWRGWWEHSSNPNSDGIRWERFAPAAYDNIPPALNYPPPGCTWKTDPLTVATPPVSD